MGERPSPAPQRRTAHRDRTRGPAQVLGYRVTYEVTDQVVALGPAPDEYVPRRTEWHRELSKSLRRW
ncbi:hypothetical protein ACH4D5_33845 [Streptomyces sp. NPDC018029]|uniref:hypothetical protein n=1 Tax=Streptomyces sp. NPDC018029 TaxID=3365032 RepID=UPI0037B4535E